MIISVTVIDIEEHNFSHVVWFCFLKSFYMYTQKCDWECFKIYFSHCLCSFLSFFFNIEEVNTL